MLLALVRRFLAAKLTQHIEWGLQTMASPSVRVTCRHLVCVVQKTFLKDTYRSGEVGNQHCEEQQGSQPEAFRAFLRCDTTRESDLRTFFSDRAALAKKWARILLRYSSETQRDFA